MELERNKAGQLKLLRRVFTVEYKAEVVRHKKAENLSFVETGRSLTCFRSLCSSGRSSTRVAVSRRRQDGARCRPSRLKLRA
jgi:hypothetical protein